MHESNDDPGGPAEDAAPRHSEGVAVAVYIAAAIAVTGVIVVAVAVQFPDHVGAGCTIAGLVWVLAHVMLPPVLRRTRSLGANAVRLSAGLGAGAAVGAAVAGAQVIAGDPEQAAPLAVMAACLAYLAAALRTLDVGWVRARRP